MGLLDLGASIGGSLIDSIFARRNTDLQNKANLKLADYQYSKELENWNRQNEYNSPKAQMQRFKDAGLNPALIYSQGNAGNATVLPHYQAPRQEYNYRPLNPFDVISKYQDLRMKDAQIDNIKQLAEINRTEAFYRPILAFNKAELSDSQNALAWYKANEENSRFQAMYGNTSYTGKYAPMQREFAQALRESILSQLKNAPVNLSKNQLSARTQALENVLKELDVKFYKASKFFDYGSKALGSIGLAGLLRKSPVKNYSPVINKSYSPVYVR